MQATKEHTTQTDRTRSRQVTPTSGGVDGFRVDGQIRPSTVPTRKTNNRKLRRYRHIDIADISKRTISGYSAAIGNVGRWKDSMLDNPESVKVLCDRIYKACTMSPHFVEPDFDSSDDIGNVFHKLLEQSVFLAEKHGVDFDLPYRDDTIDELADCYPVVWKNSKYGWNIGYNMENLDFLPALERNNPQLFKAVIMMVKLLHDCGWSLFDEGGNYIYESDMWHLEEDANVNISEYDDELHEIVVRTWEDIYSSSGLVNKYKSLILKSGATVKKAWTALKKVRHTNYQELKAISWVRQGLRVAKDGLFLPENGCFSDPSSNRGYDETIHPNAMFGFIWSYEDCTYNDQRINDVFNNSYLVENTSWAVIEDTGWDIEDDSIKNQHIYNNINDFISHRGFFAYSGNYPNYKESRKPYEWPFN